MKLIDYPQMVDSLTRGVRAVFEDLFGDSLSSNARLGASCLMLFSTLLVDELVCAGANIYNQQNMIVWLFLPINIHSKIIEE